MKQSCIVLRASGKKNLLISFASCTIVIWIILMINKLCKTTRNTSSLMYEIILMYRKTITKIHRTLRLSGFTLYQMGPIDSCDFSNDCLRFFRWCSRLFSCVQSFLSLWNPANPLSPLSRRRQLLHLLLLHLVVHLGSFVKQALQVAIGALKGGLWLDASKGEIFVNTLTRLWVNSYIIHHCTWRFLTSVGSSRLLQHCRTCSLPVCPAG